MTPVRGLEDMARDLARLCADMGEQYEAFEEILIRSRTPLLEIDERMRNLVHPLLAKLSELSNGADEPPARERT